MGSHCLSVQLQLLVGRTHGNTTLTTVAPILPACQGPASSSRCCMLPHWTGRRCCLSLLLRPQRHLQQRRRAYATRCSLAGPCCYCNKAPRFGVFSCTCARKASRYVRITKQPSPHVYWDLHSSLFVVSLVVSGVSASSGRFAA